MIVSNLLQITNKKKAKQENYNSVNINTEYNKSQYLIFLTRICKLIFKVSIFK